MLVVRWQRDSLLLTQTLVYRYYSFFDNSHIYTQHRYTLRAQSSMDYEMLGNSTHATEMYLPMPIQISVCGVLLLMSSMFAGLTLGLMSLGMCIRIALRDDVCILYDNHINSV